MALDNLESLPTSQITFGVGKWYERGLVDRVFRKPGKAYDALDVLVDGKSLHEAINGAFKAATLIALLEQAPSEFRNDVVDELLLRRSARLPGDRRPLFGCAMCGDLWCGSVSIVIERFDRWITWRDFAFQMPKDDAPALEQFRDLGPFKFDAAEYERTLLSVPTIDELRGI